MPRSSRHKSSKHSSRDAREYSEPEKEPGLKEKKGREDGSGSISSSRHLKDLASGEKRKLDSKSVDVSKEPIGVGNAEYNTEFGSGGVSSSSKKRKEKVDDDRWTGGDTNNEHEMSKSEMKEKEKEVRGSGDSKRSSRREVSYVSGFDVEEGKKSGSKAEGKHHRSERKERGEKEAGVDRERKGSRSDRSEKLVDIVSVTENTGSEGNRKQSGLGEERGGKHSVGNTDCNIQEEFKNPEPEKDLDRRVRRKRDAPVDVDRHHDAVRDPEERRLSSREEIPKSGKYKDDAHKDERNRDRFPEDIDKEIWRQDEKQRDNQSTRDYTSGKSDDKHLRNDKKDLDVSHKKSKPHGVEPERELDRDRERDHDRDRGRDRDRDRSRLEHDRDREHDDREHDIDRDRDRDRDLERVHDRDRELERDRERGRDRYRRELRERVGVRDHERRDRDHDHDHEYASHVDEKGSRYKDDRGRRKSPEVYDDYHGDKLRRAESEMDRERSLSRKPIVDSVTSSSRRRASPNSRAYVGADKYREGTQDETKYGDSLRDGTLPESVERAPKYRSGEKRAKFDDNHIREFPERSPNTKVSPRGLKERSPSSTSFDRSRFSSRNARRRSLDVDDAERRSSGSNDVRDMGMPEDRQGRDLPSKKSLGDEYPPGSPFYHKSGQGNVSSHGPGPGPGPSVFRNRGESPSFTGGFGEDSRGPGRYRRSVDPNIARGPGNAWKGVPNWPSPLPNGFMPFPPPGPHHGGFPPILSQFPPHFGVRLPMDMNHQGIPYHHMADGDRFPGHVRPVGWPNMVEGSVPPHFLGWDTGNGILRDDSSMYGPGYLSQRRDMNPDMWKQNGDGNMDVISGSQKDGPVIKTSTDEASSAPGASKPNVETSCLDDQATSFKKDASSGLSAMKEMPLTPAKGTTDKTPESSGVDDTAQSLRAYLGKLDISMDLADPELYNQCISLAIKGESEYVEDEVELEFMEEKTIVESEIMNLTVDVKIFPAAKESIFQRAMNFYKTQSYESKSSLSPDDNKTRSPPLFQPEFEQTLVVKESIDCPDDCIVELEEPTLVLPEEIVSANANVEEVKVVYMIGDEVPSGGLLQSSDLTLDVGDETQTTVLEAEKMEEETSLELIPENADKGDLSAESTYPDSINSNADGNIGGDGGKFMSSEFAPVEQLDAPVSGPLILCNDSVKVCEPIISVSNESESVVLSRIHHAPESTH